MADAVRIYGLLAWTWCRAAARHRASMLLLLVTQATTTGLDLVALLLIFSRTRELGGFDLREVMFLYGTCSLSFAAADILLGTTERLGRHIRDGTFDAFLIRPVSPLLQVATEDFNPRRLGKLVPAALVFGLSLSSIAWTPLRVLLVPVMVVSGTVIFGGIWVLTASIQFVLIDGSEAMNAVTYGGGFFCQYPLGIFGRDFLRLVTWVVPLAFVNWEPALYVLDRPDPLGLPVIVRFASPAVATTLALVAAAAWRAGLRRYRSTGS